MESARSEVDAPYGFLSDGVTPKKGPGGRPPKNGPTNKRPGGAKPPAPPRRPATPKPKAGTDYRPGLTGLFQIGAAPLLAQRKSAVLQLDGMALLMLGEEMADGLNSLAQLRPEVAAACDKLIAVGPYGAILQPFAKFAAQLAENHGWLPPQITRSFGAVSRPEMEATIIAKAQQAQADMEAAAAYVAEQAGGPAVAPEPSPAQTATFPQRIDIPAEYADVPDGVHVG